MSCKVTGVGISRTTLTLEEAGTHKLTATIAPPKATNPNVTWSTSNASVATVDSGGNVSAKSAGTAKIRVTTKGEEDVIVTESPSATVVVPETSGRVDPVETTPPGTSGSDNASDKYFSNDALKIRDKANGNQINGNKTFNKGAIVKVVQPVETKKVTDSDYTWIKVYYDGNQVGWVAKEYLEELPKPISGHNFKYKWDKSEFVTPAFKDKVVGISKRLNIDPDDLMAVMAFESYFNPAQVNNAGGSATGLIQFLPDVAEGLNTSTTELKSMTGVEQLDYVFGYFYPCAGQMNNLGDVYMKVLCPSAVGKSDEDVLWSKGSDAYNRNSGLDANQDGKITKKEAVQKVIDRRKNYE